MVTAETEVLGTFTPVEQDATRDEPAEDARGIAYDSAARQRVPLILVADGEEFDVTLILEPVSDPALTRYVKKCEEASAETDGEDELVTRLTASAAATEVLFDALASDLEGVGDEDELKPADWREMFSPPEKAAIIDQVVFGHEYVEPKRAVAGARPRWGADLRNMTTRVRFPFEGRMVETSHTLRKVSAAVYAEYSALMSRVLSARGMDAHMLRLAAWYDEHHVAHQSYKGEVPRHHRAAVFVLHMTRQRASVRKN